MFKGRTPLVIAAVAAVLSGIVAVLALQRQSAEIAKGWNLVPVVVAKKDLPKGSRLTIDKLTIAEIPERFFRKNRITWDQLRSEHILEQRLTQPLYRGDPLLWLHLESAETEENRLSNAVQLPSGRALSIRVSAETSVSHWIRPGDQVDVVSTMMDPVLKEQVAVTLMQNVIVLAIGEVSGLTKHRTLQGSSKRYSTVTLHVSPEAAELLVLAQEMGRLYLTLRNPKDNIVEGRDEKTTLKTLMSGKRIERISKEQSRRYRPAKKVEIIKGTTR